MAYCDLCGQSVATVSSSRLNRFFGAGTADAIRQCPRCGLLFRAELPDRKGGADCLEASGLRDGTHAAGEERLNTRMRRRLQYFTQRVQQGRNLGPPKVLDIGFGTGSFLKEAASNGWRVVGTEAGALPEGAAIPGRTYQLDICSTPLPDDARGSFQLVHCNHVLEHVASPRALLEAAHSYLAAGGYLCLEVPNEVRSLASCIKRALGRPYGAATAYFAHRFFFTRTLLVRIVSQAGFRVLHSATPAMELDLPLWHRTFDRVQATLGMGGVIEVHAQKQ